MLTEIPDLIFSVEKLQFNEIECQELTEISPQMNSIYKNNFETKNYYRFLYNSEGRKVVGYLIEPKEDEIYPVVIYNRGGSMHHGQINLVHLHSLKMIPNFVDKGYVVIATQYSGNDGSEGKDEFGGMDCDDVLNLYKIIKEYKKADSTRVGMYGASRGGLMTYQALSKVSWLKAAVSVAGVADARRTWEMNENFKKIDSQMYDVDSKIELDKRSAIKWADKFCKTTPILLVHGTADRRVTVLDSLELSIELYKYKVPYRLQIYEGADHGISEFRNEANVEIIKWFDRFVKNNGNLPNLELHGK